MVAFCFAADWITRAVGSSLMTHQLRSVYPSVWNVSSCVQVVDGLRRTKIRALVRRNADEFLNADWIICSRCVIKERPTASTETRLNGSRLNKWTPRAKCPPAAFTRSLVQSLSSVHNEHVDWLTWQLVQPRPQRVHFPLCSDRLRVSLPTFRLRHYAGMALRTW